MRPEDKAGVNFSSGIDGVGPEEGLGEGLDDWFIFSERDVKSEVCGVICGNLLSCNDVVLLELSTHSKSEPDLLNGMDFLRWSTST